MTQTAIEWLIEQCPRIETIVASSVLDQAKEMEKQQIIDAFDEGSDDGFYGFGDSNKEKYYNETYK